MIEGLAIIDLNEREFVGQGQKRFVHVGKPGCEMVSQKLARNPTYQMRLASKIHSHSLE
jgi:hypothetical protein